MFYLKKNDARGYLKQGVVFTEYNKKCIEFVRNY